MYWVEYYKKINGELIEECGDRGIVQLDGRNSIETMKRDAVRFNGYRRPIYSAYRIIKGESLIRTVPITKIISL